jgi:hypothetical protein
MKTICALFLLCGLGCTAGNSTATGPAPAAETPDLDFMPGPLIIPMEPLLSYDAFLVGHAEGEGIMVKEPLSLALGGAYPQRFELRAEVLYLPGCWGAAGQFHFSAAQPSQPDVATVTVVDDRTVAFEPLAEGDTQVVVTGTFSLEEPCGEAFPAGEIPLEIRVSTVVRRIVDVGFSWPTPCRDQSQVVVQSGAPLQGFGVRPLDSAGADVYPRNASQQQPVEITVTAAAGVSLALDPLRPGIAGLVAMGPRSQVQLAASPSGVMDLTLVPSSAITSMELAFPILGMGGGGLTLESGETYGETGWARTSDTVGPTVSALFVDGVSLCSQPLEASFVLETTTPSHCEVQPHNGQADYYGGVPVGSSARLLEDGLCALTVTAPAFAGGAGLSTSLSATILNVQGMIPAGPGR